MKDTAGKLVRHKDGRRGIAYYKDQKKELLFNEDKVIVRFYNTNEVLSETKTSVHINKLEIIGFVDLINIINTAESLNVSLLKRFR